MLYDGGFMTTNEIVIAIDGEIARLLKVKELLTSSDLPVKRGPGRPAGTSAQKNMPSLKTETGKPAKPRTLSAEARARIAAAQRARWAKSKRAAKKAASKSAPVPAKPIVVKKTPARKTARAKKDGGVKRLPE
jgi:hypothetical protein